MHYFAFYESNPGILDLLLNNEEDPSKWASINIEDTNTDSCGETPLHKLMSRATIPLNLLKAFINYVADVNFENKNSNRSLFEAAFYEEKYAIELIMKNVHDIDDINDWRKLALYAAARMSQTKTLQFF